MLWQGDMNADITRFRNITTGAAVIMGRKTYDSIGRPLPNRQNIVISRRSINIPGVQIARNLDDAYNLVASKAETYVIGGGEVFSQAIESVSRIIATEIDKEFDGDVYFPKLSDEWLEVSREFHAHDEKNKYDYFYVTYLKRQ